MNQFEMMSLFVLVAELGSFAAAANQRNVARSVITRQIATLEEHLGVQLIARTTRRQALTSAGKKYLEHCKTILDLVQRSAAELNEEQVKPTGNLRISLPLSFGIRHISDLLMRFAQKHPAIYLDLDYSDRMVDVAAEGYDLAIRVASGLALSDIVRKIGECQLIFVASPGYICQFGEPTCLDDLINHECLQYSNHSRWVLSKGEETISIALKGRVKANNGDGLAKASAAGMGISLIPDFIVKDYLRAGSLVELKKLGIQPPIGIYVALPSNSYIPERVRLLVEYLADQLPDYLKNN